MSHISFLWFPIFQQLVSLGDDTLKRPANSALDVMTRESDTFLETQGKPPATSQPYRILALPVSKFWYRLNYWKNLTHYAGSSA